MRFERDWLRGVLSVPYVPTLGPVHPDALSPKLFDDVAAASHTGQVLRFDEQRRWSQRKDHTVLVEEIVHQPGRTIIPTVSRRGGRTVKTYYYGSEPPDLPALRAVTTRCRVAHGAQSGQVIWFDPTAPAREATACTRVLLKSFRENPQPRQPSGQVTVLDKCPLRVRATFADFADAMRGIGFGFLHQRWRTHQVDGPFLVAVIEHHIVGAIGPLRTLPDQRGHRMMLPQYFGVLPAHRGRGHGRALWRAATAWAEHHRADYQLLQAKTGHASEGLFLSEGLTCLGFACSVSA